LANNGSKQTSEESLLDSVKLSRIIVPTLIGLVVVGYMIATQLDLNQLDSINWQLSTLGWLFLAVLMYVIRHVFYAIRLKIMTSKAFSFWKSMELIVIWEFASAISPTSVGGSGVALLLLGQEKLSGAKTVSVVLYSMILDTIFFVLSLPILYLLLGAVIIRPGMSGFSDMDGYGVTFYTVLLAMVAYGGLFFYGLFVNPNATKRFLLLISKIPFLKRFKSGLRNTALDIRIASEELQHKPMIFHLKAFGATSGAWITRFLAINFIILALVSSAPIDLLNQAIMYARAETMHVITAFSPTPGGAGVAEYLFGGFYSDYIPAGIATLVALVWRLITYYPYLILGAIIIPNWIRKILASKQD
jgi:uncharacterized protein (TIRG00374 family)